MPQPKPLPPVELLRELFDYDPDTGVVTYKKPRKKIRVGNPVGREHSAGYIWTSINSSNYLLHRLIWKMVTGSDPAGEVDHIDRNRKNNAWKNLRVVTASQNRTNAGRVGALPRGVMRNKSGTFGAQIQIKGCRQYLGTFASIEEAHQAYKAASLELQGEFSIYADA